MFKAIKSSYREKIFGLALLSILYLSLYLCWTRNSFQSQNSTLCVIEEAFHTGHSSVALSPAGKENMISGSTDASPVNKSDTPSEQPGTSAIPKDDVRRILWWTTVYGADTGFFGIGAGDALISLQGKCKAKCEFTMNKTLLEDSHGLIFHGWGKDLPTETLFINGENVTKPKNAPPQRYRDQVYIYTTMEAPVRIQADMTAFKDFFNWTMTYRLDSDFPIPYGAFVRKTPDEIDSYKEDLDLNKLANRSNLVAWMVSNCDDAPSRREKLVKELQKYIPVNVYGKCGSNQCNETIHTDCWWELSMSHKFYLSFENSLCKDYVTEKFFKAIRVNMVPVVYGAAHYSHQFAAGSFINVDSFTSAEALADYLTYLDGNDEEYLKYFQWRRYYHAVSYWPLEEAYCGACERLHKERPLVTSVLDINEWLFRNNSNLPVCIEPRDTF